MVEDKKDHDSDELEFFTPKKDLGGSPDNGTKSQPVLSPTSGRASVPISPSRWKEKVVAGTPISSPSKRGIINLDMTPNRVSTFHLKTPTGRAGLKSPKKRTEVELDRSARRRALRSTVYSRLMDQNEEEDNEYLDRQDEHLAQAVIKESRIGHSQAHMSDVEHELDVSDVGGKRRRNKSLKMNEVEPEQISDSEGSSIIDEELESENEYVPKKRVEANKSKKGNRRNDVSSGRLKYEDTYQEPEFETPRKRTKISRNNSESPTKKTPRSAQKSLSSSRRRVGRPSKADDVIGKVKSIFQMDDEEIFSRDTKSASPSKKVQDEGNDSNTLFSLGFDTTDVTEVPIVSGIPSRTKNDEERRDRPSSFIPFPIPEVDESGNIVDENFTKKYFLNVDVFAPKEENNYAKFSDEKSFFLNGSEGFFEQSNTRPKLSGNSLTHLAPSLEYSSYNSYVKLGNLLQYREKEVLYTLHQSLYHQWAFELSQGYSLNFYGVGSKRKIILDFVEDFLVTWFDDVFQIDNNLPNILVVNGYNPTVKFKNVLQDIVTSFISDETKKKNKIRFPKHVSETVPFIIRHIENNRKKSKNVSPPKLVVVLHNIDGEPFRDDKTQNLLSQLCALPEIWLISSVDHVNSSLLWDSFKLKNFNFLWHDLTTFDTYDVEMSFKDVLSMGKSKRFVGNKGAKFVLTSLTSNARKLYKLLLQSQLDMMKDVVASKATKTGLRGSIKFSIDFKWFYNNCIEQFVTSNEINFRTMLGEFVEHKMCTLTKDEAGAEKIFVPFHYDEIQSLMTEAFEQD